MTDPTQSPSVHLIDEQSPEGVTTWTVVLDHMDHGVTLHRGEDSDRASEIHFVVGYELGRREDRIRDAEAECDACEAVLAMAVARLGGHIEQRGPSGKLYRFETHRGNFLQRIDDLRATEAERDRLLEGLRNANRLIAQGRPVAAADAIDAALDVEGGDRG